ncbi:MAG: hypothetical protein MUE52_05930 [Tabrizicola sp.]|jgi:hypothetical protein|nr:hypothetical protein [Tabrizicola sp.]
MEDHDMANQETAFVTAMRLAAHNNPELFTHKDGELYFLEWKLTAWMAIYLCDLLHPMFHLGQNSNMEAV